MGEGREYHFRSGSTYRDNAPSSQDFVPLTAGESIMKDAIGDKKKMRRTQEKFLKQCKERVLSRHFHAVRKSTI